METASLRGGDGRGGQEDMCRGVPQCVDVCLSVSVGVRVPGRQP